MTEMRTGEVAPDTFLITCCGIWKTQEGAGQPKNKEPRRGAVLSGVLQDMSQRLCHEGPDETEDGVELRKSRIDEGVREDVVSL